MFMNENYLDLKNHVIQKLCGDDIVLDVKILDISILNWNTLFNYLRHKDNIQYFYAGLENTLPEDVKDSFFYDEYARLVEIYMGQLSINIAFFDINEIEFYTGSVINMGQIGFDDLFDFIKELSSVIGRNVLIYIG